MKPFRATYKPRKFDDKGQPCGYSDELAEKVLVVGAISGGIAGVRIIFIDTIGGLHSDFIDCFSECQWNEE